MPQFNNKFEYPKQGKSNKICNCDAKMAGFALFTLHSALFLSLSLLSHCFLGKQLVNYWSMSNSESLDNFLLVSEILIFATRYFP